MAWKSNSVLINRPSIIGTIAHINGGWWSNHKFNFANNDTGKQTIDIGDATSWWNSWFFCIVLSINDLYRMQLNWKEYFLKASERKDKKRKLRGDRNNSNGESASLKNSFDLNLIEKIS